jgi:hypothetical protein
MIKGEELPDGNIGGRVRGWRAPLLACWTSFFIRNSAIVFL